MDDFRLREVHELKTWPPLFDEVVALRKTFEIRKKDRSFKPGDILVLREWSPQTRAYTGRHVCKRVAFMFDGDESFGIPGIVSGYCVMALGHADDIYDGCFESDAAKEQG